ncbi:MAG: hypothetical protein FWE25_08120 [Lachnospiraceae bacterium]|nr:hypothetical protein [Lachnospiraceae bacterium]
MRKINSEFKTAFVSEEGTELINNDFFGFVELDNFACYVIADGLYQEADIASAKLAIEAIIQKFEERPSIKKSAVKRYLDAANKRLIQCSRKRFRLRTSITLVVTNYESMRYATAGNTRLCIYRGDYILAQSSDTSYAQRLIRKSGDSQDKLARHKERNNLSVYVGQKHGFSPDISHRIPLKESDVITLYTRGIWEHIDTGELLDVFGESGDEPREAVDIVEELLLSRQLDQMENYTFAAIYVNKVFEDPNRKKKIKKIIIISIIVAVVLLAVFLVVFFVMRHRQQMRDDIEDYMARVVEHMEHNNYVRALAEIEEAEELARRLRDGDILEEVGNFLRLIEAVLLGDEHLENGRFQDAQDAFLRAQGYSLRIDGIGFDDIIARLESAEAFINFFALMDLADNLVILRNYEVALSLYNEARSHASNLFFSEGRQKALDAIAHVHALMARAAEAEEKATAEAEAEAQESAQERAADTLVATETMAQGDRYFAEGDYVAARTFFQMARDMFYAQGDTATVNLLDARIALSNSRLQDRESQENLAQKYADIGQYHFNAGRYLDARWYFTLSRQIYDHLGVTWRVTQMDNQLELVRQAIERSEQGEVESGVAA